MWTPENGFLRCRWHGYDEALLVYLFGLDSPMRGQVELIAELVARTIASPHDRARFEGQLMRVPEALEAETVFVCGVKRENLHPLKRAMALQQQTSFSSIARPRQSPEMMIVPENFHVREGGTVKQ